MKERRRRGKERDRPSDGPIRAPVPLSRPARFHKTLTSVVVTEPRRGSSLDRLPGLCSSFPAEASWDPFFLIFLPRRSIDCTMFITTRREGNYVNRYVDEKPTDEWQKPPDALSGASSMNFQRLSQSADQKCRLIYFDESLATLVTRLLVATVRSSRFRSK